MMGLVFWKGVSEGAGETPCVDMKRTASATNSALHIPGPATLARRVATGEDRVQH